MSVVKGLNSLLAKLQSIGGDTSAALTTAVKQTAEVIASDARGLAPVASQSQADSDGAVALKNSISADVQTVGADIIGRVLCNAPHAAYVEFGTGPVGAANHSGVSPEVPVSYTSRPYWVYPIVIDGEETFRTTSGQAARPYMYPAAVKNRDTLKQAALHAVRAAIRKKTKG